MSRRIKVLAGASTLVVLLAAFLAIAVYAQGPNPWAFRRSGYGPGGMMGGGGSGGMMGSGMMGDYGSGGMMGGGPGMGSCSGIGGWGYPGTGTPITIDQAGEAVEQYLAGYGNPDLILGEVMEFTDNFYAEVEEESTGVYAFELLINRYTGAVYPEPGPNMMWNTKYSPMGGMMGGMMGDGMMGGWWGQSSGPVTVTPEQAQHYAQEYLDAYLPDTTVADEADAFYGYYTLHVLQDGQIVGMLSVNGYSGQVWYHTWHGDFIGMTEGHD